MNIEEEIQIQLSLALKTLGVEIDAKNIDVTSSDNRDHGDYTSNVVLKNNKVLKSNPMEIGDKIKQLLKLENVSKIEVVKPGFINFFLKHDAFSSVLEEIIKEGDNYANLNIGKGKKVNIEYVSANPTGALHLGHARGAAIGDCLSRLYKKAGYDVTREYYINDAGVQMNHLAQSLMARYLQLFNIKCDVDDSGYHGEDIIEIAKELKNEVNDKYVKDADKHLDFFKEYGGKHLLTNIKRDLHSFRVDQDVYSSEKAIRDRGDIEMVLEKLKPYCYNKDNALFLNTTKDNDDKDRVIVKSDGSYTYLLPDIAYHNDKFNRGFDILIDLFGADHHGYVARLKSSQKDLGHNPDALHVSLVQMVRLIKDGEEVKMSKRTGNAISLKELLEEAGVDPVRYFFVSRANSSHLDFDIDFATSLGNENPVFYAQYTHARLCGILRNKPNEFNIQISASLLTSDVERDLLILLKGFSKVIIEAINENEPYKITNYIQTLSKSINEFYTKCRVIDNKNIELSCQRLALVKACKIVLANALNLIAVSAPEKMSIEEKQ